MQQLLAPFLIDLDVCWASYLGCLPEQLRDGGRHVAARPMVCPAGRPPWPVIQGPICAFTTGRGWVMSVPGNLVELARATCAGLSFGELVCEGDRAQQDWFDRLRSRDEAERPGPYVYPAMAELAAIYDLRGWSHYAFSYADPASWRGTLDCHVLRITEGQPTLWAQWQHWPGPMCSTKRAADFGVADAFGYVLDGRLVSVGQIQAFRDEYAWEYGVDTLPAYRCRGYATAVLHAVTAHIIFQNHIPYHYTDVYNRPSMRLPNKLGYTRYGEGLFSHARR